MVVVINDSIIYLTTLTNDKIVECLLDSYIVYNLPALEWY